VCAVSMPFWTSQSRDALFLDEEKWQWNGWCRSPSLEFTFEELPTALIQRNRIHKPIHIRRSHRIQIIHTNPPYKRPIDIKVVLLARLTVTLVRKSKSERTASTGRAPLGLHPRWVISPSATLGREKMRKLNTRSAIRHIHVIRLSTEDRVASLRCQENPERT
jgi:hypothetical protein